MAMTIQELREKRAKAWDTARDFLDSKRNASGVLSAEDSATYDQLEQTVVDLGKEIQRLERQQSIEAEMSKPTSSPILGTPTSTQADIKIGTASDVYKKAFWDNFRGRGYGSIRDDLRIGENSEVVIFVLTSTKRSSSRHSRRKTSSAALQPSFIHPLVTARFQL